MAKAFKEWQVVCDALAAGRQWLILRKGGIHEGRQGFSFAEEAFFLFPTRFHNQSQFVKEGEIVVAPEWQPGEEVVIKHYVEVPRAGTLTDWQQVAALGDAHIWTEDTIRQRFDWQGKGMAAGSIHVALARVWELAAPFSFPYEARHGGCRSWVEVPEPPDGWREFARPVMSDEDFARVADGFPI
jgi:hypothetical protein